MESIIRGTNALIQLKLKEDIDFSQLASVELCIFQAGNCIVKEQSDLYFDEYDKTISYELTQPESLSLVAGRDVEITAWGLINGKRFETRPILKAHVEATRKNEVIT